jgi:aryl-alcohol dehydrogenase-like predicted oxidoreductase
VQRRPFGRTGLDVPVLGFGAMQLGDPRLPEATAALTLHRALDLGITLIDTARSYGISEERIGRHLADRRDEFVLSTKVGYGVEGHPDWTYDCVMAGVDAARDRLRTDIIDIVHLHSCNLGVLEAGEVASALVRCAELGKLRVAAYSGDDETLRYAIGSGMFGSVQASTSLCDQQSLDAFAVAREKGLGTLAKRALAGRPWASPSVPSDSVHAEYHRRFTALRDSGLDCEPGQWDKLALRFAAYAPGVDCVIVGGTDPAHLERNLAAISAGPLELGLEARLREMFRRAGPQWRGLV